MLSTSLVVAGLTTGQKIGLASVGGAFILFALISSLVLPRRSPNVPRPRGRLVRRARDCCSSSRCSARCSSSARRRRRRAAETTPTASTPAGTTSDHAGSAAGRRRRDGRQGRLHERRLRQLPHPQGRRLDRQRRPEPRHAEACVRSGQAPGRKRRRPDAGVQGHAERQADRRRRRVRLERRRQVDDAPRSAKPARGRGGISPQSRQFAGQIWGSRQEASCNTAAGPGHRPEG